MQNYEAQGEIIKGKQQSVRTYVGNLQTNTDTLRSNFSGTQFPDKPVTGQHCFREDLQVEYIYNGDAWIENDEQGTIAKEVIAARGSHDNLKARLDVALNDDGTLKAGAEINMNEWKESLMTPSYIDEKRFSVPNDVTTVFTPARALSVTLGDNTKITSVDTSSYDDSYNRTIVTCVDAVVNATIQGVKLSVIQNAMPSDVVRVKELKSETKEIYKHNHTEGKGNQIPAAGIASKAVTTEKIDTGAVTGEKIASGTITADKLDPKVLSSSDMDVRSTGFKPHIASGFDMNIDGQTGKLVVGQGRAFVNGKYRDMWESIVIDEKGSKGLVYADKGSSDNATVKFKAFEKPSSFVTEGVAQEDILFMTDFEIDSNNVPTQLIEDLSGNGCNLTCGGTTSGLEVKNVISWNVPNDKANSDSCFWDSGANNFKGFEKDRPWSLMFYFIPKTGVSDAIPIHIQTTKGVAYDTYFRLRNWDAVSETYCAEFYCNQVTNISNSNSPSYPTTIFRNKPCLLVFEYDGHNVRFYVNGLLAYIQKLEKAIPEATGGRILINQYAGKANYLSTVTPLFACIRQGTWGDVKIAELANRMGVPNEHVGYSSGLPTLYHGETGGAFSSGYHAWDFNEEQGSTVYDKNPDNPMHGTVTNGPRIPTTTKNFNSVDLSGTGFISFGNYALKDEFSFFTCLTIYGDGTVVSNHVGSGGFILDAYDKYLRTYFNAWRNTSKRIPYGQPIVVGVTVKGNTCSVYSDSTEPETFNFTNWSAFRTEEPFVIGQYGASSNRIKAQFHGAVMADRVFTPAEIRSIFRAFKKREYKNIADDMGLSNYPIIGMVKTNQKGEAEEIENYPTWGRRKNPFANQKYFLGWYQTIDARVYRIPNYYGSSRVRINMYRCQSKNSPVIRTLPSDVAQQSSRATGGTYSTKEYYPITGLGNTSATCNAISYYAQQTAGNIDSNSGVMDNRSDWATTNVWLGIEVEPIADDIVLDSIDY